MPSNQLLFAVCARPTLRLQRRTTPTAGFQRQMFPLLIAYRHLPFHKSVVCFHMVFNLPFRGEMRSSRFCWWIFVRRVMPLLCVHVYGVAILFVFTDTAAPRCTESTLWNGSAPTSSLPEMSASFAV
ncbi:hypothetical protein Tcan_15979 [Toxocara canis]|uniref:Transmembrane protein n=1 Tax=Toxocara canis TaxID=6265 RepID=A0A0B2W375_TOXCA|nr:hypothetical protein Tcan_15979 [Toxocara canis]